MNASFQVRSCCDVDISGSLPSGSWSVDDVTVYDPACVTPL